MSFLQVDVKPTGCNFWEFAIFLPFENKGHLLISSFLETFPILHDFSAMTNSGSEA